MTLKFFQQAIQKIATGSVVLGVSGSGAYFQEQGLQKKEQNLLNKGLTPQRICIGIGHRLYKDVIPASASSEGDKLNSAHKVSSFR